MAGKGGLIVAIIIGGSFLLGILSVKANEWTNGHTHCEGDAGFWGNLSPSCAVEDAKEVLGTWFG